MSKTNESEFASAADMIAPAEGESEVYLKTLKKKVLIQKINIGELSAILKAAGDEELLQLVYLVFKGLIRPKLNLDETKKLPVKVIAELAAEITKFSELDKESIEKNRNLLTTGS